MPLGKVLKDGVTNALAARGIKIASGEKDVGYELRCNKPTAFDRDYTRDLGAGAVFTLLGGTGNLTRNSQDFSGYAGFPGSLRSVLEALEEQVVVLKLLDSASDPGQVLVRIGDETNAEQIRGASVIATSYGTADTIFGGMGVLGPTRMDYPGTMASVAAVARYVGDIIADA